MHPAPRDQADSDLRRDSFGHKAGTSARRVPLPEKDEQPEL
jgi:hypothetical protein